MDIVLSPWVRVLGLPVVGIFLSVLARGLSKQYRPLIVPEDFFVGPQLIVTSTLLSGLLAIERYRVRDMDGLLMFGGVAGVMIVALFTVSWAIREFGWRSRTKLNGIGVILPLLVGTGMLGFVGMLLTEVTS